MKKIVLVVYLLWSASALALMPVEGILMGEADLDIQKDPLNHIFKEYYDTSDEAFNAKVKLYRNFYDGGIYLSSSCSNTPVSRYSTPWQEKQAQRFIVSTLQYLGIDLTIRAIGAYAKHLQIDKEAFQNLKKNLVGNYCSKNITVFSNRTINKAFDHYFENPQSELIPTFANSPMATKAQIALTESALARSREFDRLIENFRAFCSWGGELDDYRMLTPYLRNAFIMNWVYTNLRAMKPYYEHSSRSVKEMGDVNSVQVVCEEHICRRSTPQDFWKRFPRAVGSFRIFNEYISFYCAHFKFKDPTSATIPDVKIWRKAQELEDPILETNYFISLITGVPDPYFGSSNYSDLLNVAKSSFQERWNTFAANVLGSFSKDLLYEESLRISPESHRDPFAIKHRGFKIDFSITLGEMDRISNSDMLSLTFDLKVTKNYFRWIRREWGLHSANLDKEGLEKLKKQVTNYLATQIKQKEKYFRQKMWDESFAELIADELMAQLKLYDGPMFDSLEDKLITIPVRFSYGVFALGYLKYRADVNAGRLKLNL